MNVRLTLSFTEEDREMVGELYHKTKKRKASHDEVKRWIEETIDGALWKLASQLEDDAANAHLDDDGRNIGDEIVEGLEQAVAYEHGELTEPVRVLRVPIDDPFENLKAFAEEVHDAPLVEEEEMRGGFGPHGRDDDEQ